MDEYYKSLEDVSDSIEKNLKIALHQQKSSLPNVGGTMYSKPDFYDESDKPKSKVKEKEKVSPLPEEKLSSQSNSSKKKTKFFNLYSEEGVNKDVILIPGRLKCDCQASKHKLINNCLKCGRIVCEQEGSGPCAFCQTLVISKEEKEIINRGTKKSEALHNKLIHCKKVIDNTDTKVVSKGLQKAIEHKNKLLEYDLTSEKRTKVYDDESDYFQSNSKWVNPADREKLQTMEEEMIKNKYDRNNKKFTIDLLGRKFVNDHEPLCEPEIQEILEGKPDLYSYKENDIIKTMNLPHPVYVETMDPRDHTQKDSFVSSGGLQRIQDKELQEMRDEGMCLSMHQPWASLLIAGIKVHEGRNWYHSHRGRLWIASAAKVPTEMEIKELEERSKIVLNNKSLKFPQNYPPSCLLGCVDVVDVLPQEEYRRQFPQGESESPYVFVCEHPQEMILKFPVKGQHKIYKLDSKIHQSAQKSLKLN